MIIKQEPSSPSDQRQVSRTRQHSTLIRNDGPHLAPALPLSAVSGRKRSRSACDSVQPLHGSRRERREHRGRTTDRWPRGDVPGVSIPRSRPYSPDDTPRSRGCQSTDRYRPDYHRSPRKRLKIDSYRPSRDVTPPRHRSPTPMQVEPDPAIDSLKNVSAVDKINEVGRRQAARSRGPLSLSSTSEPGETPTTIHSRKSVSLIDAHPAPTHSRSKADPFIDPIAGSIASLPLRRHPFSPAPQALSVALQATNGQAFSVHPSTQNPPSDAQSLASTDKRKVPRSGFASVNGRAPGSNRFKNEFMRFLSDGSRTSSTTARRPSVSRPLPQSEQMKSESNLEVTQLEPEKLEPPRYGDGQPSDPPFGLFELGPSGNQLAFQFRTEASRWWRVVVQPNTCIALPDSCLVNEVSGSLTNTTIP